jgi:hypothetical protein
MALLAGEVAATRDGILDNGAGWAQMSGLGQHVTGQQALHLKGAQRLEADRRRAATGRMIMRWSIELEALLRAVRPETVWDFDELMVAASRARKAVVMGNVG